MNKKGQMNVWLIVLLVIFGSVALVAIGYTLKVALFPVKILTKNIDTANDVIDKTYTAENAIYNYEWFKSQYEKIQANREKIETVKEQIKDFKVTYGNASSWDWSTKQEYSRLNTILTGLKNYDKDIVADYNARSKMSNRNIFKDLPMNVDNLLW